MNERISPQLHSQEHHFAVRLSATPRGARGARLLATAWLGLWGLPPYRTQSAKHVVAELTANAATHGRVPGRDAHLALTLRGNVLRVEVTDTKGDQMPGCPQLPPLDAESGRGMLIVEALADRWGVETGPVPRKTVWAELDLAPGHGPPRTEAHSPG
ncbi:MULTISPECIES: ATP-binding protein [Streptomyces]|uniref:ATP-binding protein n=2 Tax=Streptomyces TaxID=1883 RepID=A0ABD5ER59_9ACTN|nr:MULTISPECIES: ATP-binding protein [unclassified Streptomyces]MDT0436830.1 ATP-binding protein [Streptomyces sp. DSM 41981]MYQ63681.1 ATP-binding protein [Streptomyces sp. SID4950]SCD63101.1 Anti-sigma regulatory factor (Ser/Thr protein kinase) [Streptomyces sp. SolWspMP-5a-2]